MEPWFRISLIRSTDVEIKIRGQISDSATLWIGFRLRSRPKIKKSTYWNFNFVPIFCFRAHLWRHEFQFRTRVRSLSLISLMLIWVEHTVCRNFSGDADCMKHLPLASDGADLYAKCQDGILLWSVQLHCLRTTAALWYCAYRHILVVKPRFSNQRNVQ